MLYNMDHMVHVWAHMSVFPCVCTSLCIHCMFVRVKVLFRSSGYPNSESVVSI